MLSRDDVLTALKDHPDAEVGQQLCVGPLIYLQAPTVFSVNTRVLFDV